MSGFSPPACMLAGFFIGRLTISQRPFAARPSARFLPPQRTKVITCFATRLIAAKSVKSCDGGVLGALDSLLKPEQNGALNGAAIQGLRTFATFKRFSGRKPGRAGFRKRPLRDPICAESVPNLCRICAEPALNPHRIRIKPAPVFRTRLTPARKAVSLPSPLRNHRCFRYWFDSSKARQTVRWGRFRGLGFALETGAKRALNGAELQGRFRTFAAFERFPRRKPGRAGFRKQPLRARICAEPALNPHRIRIKPAPVFRTRLTPARKADFATSTAPKPSLFSLRF